MSEHTQVQAHRPALSAFTAVRSGLLQRACACGKHSGNGGECEECRHKRETTLQRQVAGAAPARGVPPIVHEVLRSPGQPLDAATRAFMEPRFGHDFSHVRVHTDAKAAQSARAVNALAYTVGRDVVFGARQYGPRTAGWRQVLAHELTHTIQQEQGAAAGAQMESALQVNELGDAYEHEAKAQAARIMTEPPARPTQVHNHVTLLQRQADPTQVPAGMTCPLPTTSASGVVTNNLLFGSEVATLSAAQKAEIEAFVVSWLALGASLDVRVDGFASVDGPQGLNWQLSCDRAEAVRAELMRPSSGSSRATVSGIPAGRITFFAHGETSEFGPGAGPNRRATITTPTPLLLKPKCGPDATDWFVRQIAAAMKDPDVLSIQRDISAADKILVSHGTSAQEAAEGATAAAVTAESASLTAKGKPPPPMDPTIAGQLAAGTTSGFASLSALSGHPYDAVKSGRLLSRAAANWKALVNHGARYDFKAHTMKGPSTAHCPNDRCRDSITLCPGATSENCYLTDLPGNLFYASIGRFVGWSELTLQLGSQLAQLTGTGKWDPPEDTAAIHLGFALPLPLTTADLCAPLPVARSKLTARPGCDDCTEPTTAAIK